MSYIDVKVGVSSKKQWLNLGDIKVPANFGVPNANKLLKHFEEYVQSSKFDPIIVDQNNVLIDGYTTYLIFQYYNLNPVTVYKIYVNVK